MQGSFGMYARLFWHAYRALLARIQGSFGRHTRAILEQGLLVPVPEVGQLSDGAIDKGPPQRNTREILGEPLGEREEWGRWGGGEGGRVRERDRRGGRGGRGDAGG